MNNCSYKVDGLKKKQFKQKAEGKAVSHKSKVVSF